MLERHARWVIRRRWWVVAAWIVLLAIGLMLAPRIGDVTSNQVTLPGKESQRGIDLIEQKFGNGESSSLQVVYRNPNATVDDASYREPVTAGLRRAAAIVPGTQVIDYYSSGSSDLVGDDGHLTYATLRMPISPEDGKDEVVPVREAVGTPPGFEKTLVGGQAAFDHDTAPIFDDDLKKAEVIAFPLALLILLIVFGTVVSALLPIAVAVVTIVMALGTTYLVGQATTLAVYVTNVITLIGIGIGIDYSLLMVSRFREELRAGHDRDAAVVRTVATAGHSVIFSGTTVAIGLAVLVFLNVPFIRSMGIGGMLVPIFAVLAGLTLLPALLYLLGPRVNAWRVPYFGRRVERTDGRRWTGLANWIMDHAAPVFAVTTAFMVLLAVPSIFLSVEQNQLADAPGQAEAVQAGRVLQDSLGGAVNPDTYVIDTGRPGGVYEAANFAALGDFAKRLSAQTAVVKAVTWPTDKTAAEIRAGDGDGFVDETGRYALMNIAPYGDSLSNSARDLNDRLKQEKSVIERAIPGSEVTLTGDPALQNDFNDAVYGPFPYLVLLVLVLAYLALLRAFRSVVLPLKAVVLNLLSILATYGLLVIVFQWGFGASLLGVDHDVRGIAPWIPVFLFAFLFGLSMDYEVFLISRMRELHDRGLDTRDSVSQGLARTGRIVTSAALVMVVAFSGFIIGSSTDLKEFGFGLAAAIAIDATIVRILLVPSLMRLLGRRNWYLPARVARLARVRTTPRTIPEG
jgi:putative drug exporter of the RND superfamily